MCTTTRSPIGRSRRACCRALKPSPGAVEFGEVYLSWNERGLALATIGQDYFDIDLFAYDGEFPLVDAYRVELGVDFGAGPRRFTLFFIPPRTKLHDHPEMAALLCAGPRRNRRSRRAAIRCRGAEAVYFGADQPRITAEMLMPWSALGIAPPQAGRQIARRGRGDLMASRALDVAVGHAPERAMADPAHWLPMRLGDGLALKRPAGAPG